MPGFDWNGNGKKDAFDHFMDMKVMSETSDKSSSSTTHKPSSIQKKSQESSQQKETESNGTTIVKSILCIGVCVLGFVIMANVGGLIGALALIGAAFLGYKIMNL